MDLRESFLVQNGSVLDTLKARARAGKRITRYHAEILYKQALASMARRQPAQRSRTSSPAVTVFITNINNRYPLELTLRSLRRHTAYPNYEVWVADNGSTDGSIEMMKELQAEGWPLRVIEHGEARPQHEWYDFMARETETPYWVGIHEDMMFVADGWLEDLIDFMEENPDVYLLGGEYFPPSPTFKEPVSGEVIDLQESLSTWIFGARSSLRDHIDTSFAFHKYWDEERQCFVCWDQGGKLIHDMRERGLRFACMPKAYERTYQHIANISWAFKYTMKPEIRRYKLHQLTDVKRRVAAYRS